MSAPSSELASVASVLRTHPSIEAVAVFTTTGRDPGRQVVAAVPRSYCNPVDLRDYVWDTVPADEVPDVLVTVAELPRTPDGEVDTARLERETLDQPGACTFRPLETPTEVAVGAVWSEVLGRSRIGADDNFLDLGGDSMTGILLLDLVNERLGVELSFDELLATASLSELAALVDRP